MKNYELKDHKTGIPGPTKTKYKTVTKGNRSRNHTSFQGKTDLQPPLQSSNYPLSACGEKMKEKKKPLQ